MTETWRVVRAIGALEARRWWNRTPLLRRNAKRDATQRKGAPAKLLLIVVSLVLSFNVLNSATRVVYGVAYAAERSSAPGEAFVAPEALVWLDDILSGARPTGIVQSTQEEQLEELYEFVARNEWALERDEREVRISELRDVFNARGRAGFHATRLEPGIWPSETQWYRGADPLSMLAPLAAIAFILAVSVLCFTIVGSDRDLSRSDATFEWWFTFPVPTRALLLARIVGTTLVNPLAWLLLTPFYFVVFWCAGLGPYLGLLLGIAAALYVTVLGACLRVTAELGLRRFLAPRRVSHVQAVLEVMSAVPLLAAWAASSKAGLHYLIEHSRVLPLHNPLSLPIAWLLPHGWLVGAAAALLMIAAVVATLAFGSAMLRDGLISANEPVTGSRTRLPVASGASRPLLRVVAARETLAVVRDPSRVARVLLLPLSLAVMSAISDPKLLRTIISHPEHASGAAFAIGTFVLIGGGLTTLANEGAGLWLLYTSPWPLDVILARRAALWALLAGAGTLATLLIIALVVKDVRFVLNGHAALALIGVGIYGFIAVALGALGTDVMESSRVKRLQPFTPQLFLLLTGMFTFALYSQSAWVKFAQLSLSTLFAFALWQKLRDHTPYFLDPTEAPPPAIAVSDGIFAALAFFVLQGLLGFLFTRLRFSPGLVLMFSFTGAGLLASVAALWTLYRVGVPALWRTVGLELVRPLQSIALGVLAGVLAGGGALLYTTAITRVEWLRRWYEDSEGMNPTPEQLAWLGVLAVCAAPLFEELLFRGILYRGLRRSLGARPSIFASALVFALVHPATSFAPVFGMALLAAGVFELTGSLLAPILTHMVYNGIALAVALHGAT